MNRPLTDAEEKALQQFAIDYVNYFSPPPEPRKRPSVPPVAGSLLDDAKRLVRNVLKRFLVKVGC